MRQQNNASGYPGSGTWYGDPRNFLLRIDGKF